MPSVLRSFSMKASSACALIWCCVVKKPAYEVISSVIAMEPAIFGVSFRFLNMAGLFFAHLHEKSARREKTLTRTGLCSAVTKDGHKCPRLSQQPRGLVRVVAQDDRRAGAPDRQQGFQHDALAI